jgi:hypothetical protein
VTRLLVLPQVVQQVAARLVRARQRAAALPGGPTRSAKDVGAAASPDHPLNPVSQPLQARQPPARAAPASADRAAAVPPPLTEQAARAQLLEGCRRKQALWTAAVMSERALYLEALTRQAYDQAVAHVAEHQAHLGANLLPLLTVPLSVAREQIRAQRLLKVVP